MIYSHLFRYTSEALREEMIGKKIWVRIAYRPNCLVPVTQVVAQKIREMNNGWVVVRNIEVKRDGTGARAYSVRVESRWTPPRRAIVHPLGRVDARPQVLLELPWERKNSG